MRILLDTHTVLWFFDDVSKVSKTAYDAIMNPDNEKFVSTASAWEIAMKLGLRKLKLDGGVAYFVAALEDNGFAMLPIKSEYIKRLEAMPYHPHHRDPFDRMLVASATSEGMRLVSADAAFQQYDVEVLW
jgi:PIN domain nuclease of toxin-antitoxin system